MNCPSLYLSTEVREEMTCQMCSIYGLECEVERIDIAYMKLVSFICEENRKIFESKKNSIEKGKLEGWVT